jgi:site-specific recombinase XerC
MGKGRRERVLPLWKETTATINDLVKIRQATSTPELFLNAGGERRPVFPAEAA